MFTRPSRTVLQLFAALVMIAMWAPRPAQAAVLLAADVRQLSYVCCGTGDPATEVFKSLDISYPVNITGATLVAAPAGCQVVSVGMKAIVDCTNRLNKDDRITVNIDPNNNGNVTACWDPDHVCITPAVAVPEPRAWGLMILGFFGLGLVLRRRAAAAWPSAGDPLAV